MRRLPLLLKVLLVSLCMAGCAPTYPKEKIEESVIKICKQEYGLDVKVAIVGKTLGVFVPIPNLIDFTFAITKEASDKINGVLLSATRVAISTDADLDFYCVIAHDARLPEIQVVIIKAVDDVKRFLLTDISRDEYSKRMLIDIRLNPQAQKEKTIRGIFDKMNLDPQWQEQVLDDFFRTEPTTLSDLGYWSDRFYLKDITLTEFLAEQIASRFKLAFKEDKKLRGRYLVKSSNCKYSSKAEARFFKLEVLLRIKNAEDIPEGTSGVVFENGLKVISHVVHAYRFEDFHYCEIIDRSDNTSLIVSKEKLEDFRRRKIKLDDILRENSLAMR